MRHLLLLLLGRVWVFPIRLLKSHAKGDGWSILVVTKAECVIDGVVEMFLDDLVCCQGIERAKAGAGDDLREIVPIAGDKSRANDQCN